MVDIKFEKEFDQPLKYRDLKQIAELEKMLLFRKGIWFSIQPIKKNRFNIILNHAGITKND